MLQHVGWMCNPRGCMAWSGAERAGYQAIMVTVDAPILGKREADEVNGCAIPLAD